MSTKSKLSHYLDLGDLSECHDATIHFDWYVAPRQREDDYNELTINEVWIELEGHKAFVQDGSDYRADLLTMPDFGCVLHEAL